MLFDAILCLLDLFKCRRHNSATPTCFGTSDRHGMNTVEVGGSLFGLIVTCSAAPFSYCTANRPEDAVGLHVLDGGGKKKLPGSGMFRSPLPNFL